MTSIAFESPLVARTLLAEVNPALLKSLEGVPDSYVEVMVRDELMVYISAEEQQFALNIQALLVSINETLSEIYGDNEIRRIEVLNYCLHPLREIGETLSKNFRTFYDFASKGELWDKQYGTPSKPILMLSREEDSFINYKRPASIKRSDVNFFFMYCGILQWNLRYSFDAEESDGEVFSSVDGVGHDWVKLFKELRQFNRSFSD